MAGARGFVRHRGLILFKIANEVNVRNQTRKIEEQSLILKGIVAKGELAIFRIAIY